MDTEETKLKKYIRTFAGDMAVLKKGGTPDLAPLEVPKAPPTEPLVAETPKPPLPNLGPLPEFQVNKPPSPAPVSELVTPLETYASDFSDRMRDTKASPATVLAAEQDAAPKVPQSKQKPAHTHTVLYVFAGVAFLVAGGWGVYAAYLYRSGTPPPLVLEPTIFAPIVVEEREQVSGTGLALLQAIKQSMGRSLASGTFRLLYGADPIGSTSSPQAATSIFSALQFPAPDKLMRNVQAAGSMAGIMRLGDTQSPFFILSVASYGETFSGMLSWESVMPRDLAQLFPSYLDLAPAIIVASSTTATSTPATTTASVSKVVVGFRDETVSNHDIRVYRDASGRSVIAYGYRDQRTLVIARDPAALRELFNRLASVPAR